MKNLIIILIIGFLQLRIFSQWSDFSTIVTGDLNSVSVSGNSSIWVCGKYGVVQKSDNGVTWSSFVPPIFSMETCQNIFSIGDSLAFLCTVDQSNNISYLYKLNSTALSWNRAIMQPNGKLNAVWFRNMSTGIVVGDPVGGRWTIFRTNNLDTWDSTGLRLPQTDNEKGWENSLYVKGDSVWFGTDRERIYFSTNFGLNWFIQGTIGSLNVKCIYFNPSAGNAGEGYAGGSKLFKTTNWGNNWQIVTSFPGTGDIVGIIDNKPATGSPIYSNLWVVRTDGKIYRSIDGGNTWTVDYTSPAGNYTFIRRDIFQESGKLFATKTNGEVSECTCSILGITQINNSIPENYLLQQNYPNPFNPVTNIEFGIPAVGFVKIKIYDALGREITSLVNEEMKAGTYKVEFDASNYPSGVYFYSIISENFTETRKMTLLR